MTAVFIAIALKSLLVAGLTLGLLAWCRNRSAAERSCIAHFGLVALLVVALAPLVLPRLEIEAPAWFVDTASAPASATMDAPVPAEGTPASAPMAAAAKPMLDGPALLTMAYALPAFALLLITLLAIMRLLALRARADVLVDGHWLGALARAQRRMGFKHGTALLTSNELDSPISWGLMRPVILLNDEAVAATGQAEAIIAHELAHVARLDWIKLLLARVVTALFWFNPLVWLLAREAHQLREESADDAVLGADIADTDYAELLVGVARHDCPGLLLGAHGVAPARNSLSRRIRRVLDRTLARGPAARQFALGVLAGATVVAAPLAALTIAPKASNTAIPAGEYYTASDGATALPADLPTLIAAGVGSAVDSVPGVGMSEAEEVEQAAREARIEAEEQVAEALADAHEARAEAVAEAHERRAVAVAQAGQTVAIASGGRTIAIRSDGRSARIAVGLSDDRAAAMRAASPGLRNLPDDDLIGLHVVGVTPEFARDLTSAGYGGIDADQLVAARAIGVTGRYAREITAAGVRPSIEDLIEMRTIGVPGSFVARARAQGHDVRDTDRLIELFLTGGTHDPGG